MNFGNHLVITYLVIAVDMKQSTIIILIMFVLMYSTDGQYPGCIKNCRDGELMLAKILY